MENKEEIIKRLHSGDAEQVEAALLEIKTDGDISVVPALLDTLATAQEHGTVTLITNLLSDIKDPSFGGVLAGRVESAPSQEAKARFLRICWESSLDYSDYAELFAGILIQDDFPTALEASTILEEMHSLCPEKWHTVTEMLQQADVPDEKRFLIDSTLEALRHEHE